MTAYTRTIAPHPVKGVTIKIFHPASGEVRDYYLAAAQDVERIREYVDGLTELCCESLFSKDEDGNRKKKPKKPSA